MRFVDVGSPAAEHPQIYQGRRRGASDSQEKDAKKKKSITILVGEAVGRHDRVTEVSCFYFIIFFF